MSFQVVTWRRPTDVTAEDEAQQAEWTVVAPKRFEMFEAQRVVTETERSMLRRKNLKIKPTMQVRLVSVTSQHK